MAQYVQGTPGVGSPFPFPYAPVDPIDHALLDELGEMLGPRLADIIATFVDNLDGQLADLRHALDTGDVPAIRAAAHRLKGSAGSIGALALGDAAASVERAAALGDVDAVTTHAAPLETIAREAVAALHAR
jgi:HPt (histidine-containing phosphotransfer) domain-containing protein